MKPCPFCQGAGVIVSTVQVSENDFRVETEVCHECHGLGRK